MTALRHLLAELRDQVGQPLVGVSILCRLLAQQAPERACRDGDARRKTTREHRPGSPRAHHADGYLAPV